MTNKRYKIGDKTFMLAGALTEKFKCLTGAPLNPRGRQISKKVGLGKINWTKKV